MPTPRIKATLHGETLGWYDTLAEAQAAIAAAEESERSEESELERELFGDAGCPGSPHA